MIKRQTAHRVGQHRRRHRFSSANGVRVRGCIWHIMTLRYEWANAHNNFYCHIIRIHFIKDFIGCIYARAHGTLSIRHRMASNIERKRGREGERTRLIYLSQFKKKHLLRFASTSLLIFIFCISSCTGCVPGLTSPFRLHTFRIMSHIYEVSVSMRQ